MAELKEGQKAPAFSLTNQDGKKVALKDFTGKKVVVFFYPKDMTPGCTQEACDFRDNVSRLKKTNAVVLGISKDSEEMHKKFENKYELNFPLLADVDGKVCEKYGVIQMKNMYGKKYLGIVRTTFVISENGKIAKIFNKVKVAGHVDEVLEALA